MMGMMAYIVGSIWQMRCVEHEKLAKLTTKNKVKGEGYLYVPAGNLAMLLCEQQ